MSVRNGLLAVLAQGACYGYQLKSEYERRSAAARALNVGQVYSTLDRLERDGLVERSDADPDGRAFFAITPAGRTEVAAWLAAPVPTAAGLDELARKFAIAFTLTGVDVERMLARQRADAHARRAAESEHRLGLGEASSADRLGALVAADARLARLDAELAWLDAVEERLRATRTGGALPPIPISGEPPRRGRPPKSRTTAA